MPSQKPKPPQRPNPGTKPRPKRDDWKAEAAKRRSNGDVVSDDGSYVTKDGYTGAIPGSPAARSDFRGW